MRSSFENKAEKRERYDNLKFRVKLLEERNYSRLILFPSGGGWYKMAGNSLLIYYYEIAKRVLKKKPNVQPDSDFTKTIFTDGIISFRDINGLEEKLEKAGKLKKKIEDDEIVQFELGIRLSKTELEKLRQDFRIEQDRALAVIQPKIVLAPEIFETLTTIQTRTFEMVRKMSVFERDYNGMLIAEYARKMRKFYMLQNLGIISEEEGWRKMFEAANLLLIEISFASELRIISKDTAVSIGEKVVEIKKEVERRIKK